MLKKLKTLPKETVLWQGEVVAEIRGLNPEDISSILVTAGEDLAGVFSAAEEFETIDFKESSTEMVAEQLMAQWPKLVAGVATHLPDVLAKIVACAADSPDEWEMVRDEYPFALQFEILVVLGRLTFDSPEGFKRFVGNVLLLVDLAGKLTSGGKRLPSTSRGRRISGDGSTASSSGDLSSSPKGSETPVDTHSGT